jgi:hypothetical protein
MSFVSCDVVPQYSTYIPNLLVKIFLDIRSKRQSFYWVLCFRAHGFLPLQEKICYVVNYFSMYDTLPQNR